ncbi:GGDEF domain-containing protein [Marinomonas ostreistagni]|uniref:GGDEF domain-containing protein n=1 Tax=Marinomonas ostreistagni TaxID=359209 RepID=UPI00194F7517|nr:GGDEF domain-containing protein [Marinomonas ostreistagni]MBM6551204.1 GGDEF domain-containing protein [Marinomonas ostreistagni]
MPQRVTSLFIPLFILLGSLLAGVYTQQLPNLALALLPWLPYILVVVMALMAWHFNRGKVLLAGLLILTPAFFPYIQNDSLPSSATTVTALGLGLLLLLRERGFFNRYVFNRFLFLAMLLMWSFAYEKQWVHFKFLAFAVPLIDMPLSTLLCWAVVVLALGLCLYIWWRANDAFSSAVLVSLLTLLLLEVLTLNRLQESALRSAQILIWIWFFVAESHRMAYRDELTQLPSRRALNEALQALPRHYAIAMLDVDHFKKFNDSYGHDKGDEVLQKVAEVLQQFNGYAAVFRYGGEEFTLLFKGRHLEQAGEVLEQVREQISAQQLDVSTDKKTKHVSVSASLGLAHAQPNEWPDEVIKRADEALYKAKRKGRNCIVTARSPNKT